MISKHVRSKSDTDFHINQEYLNSIHTNLNSFNESKTELSSTDFKKIRRNVKSAKLPLLFPEKRKPRKKNSIQDTQNIVQLLQSLFKFIKEAILFKRKCDKKVINGFIRNQKFHINTILLLIREHIKKFKIQNSNNEELVNNVDKFDNVIQAIIEIKPEEYYQELKTMILNEFEKTRDEIVQSIKDDKEKYESLFPLIISVSQVILFVISIFSYRLDYYSLTLNCIAQKVKLTIITFLEMTRKEMNKQNIPKSIEKELKVLLIVIHIFSLERTFTQEFYRKGESNISINAFSSFGRYILSNLIQMMASYDELITMNENKKTSIYTISRQSGITLRNFIGRMNCGHKALNSSLWKFFRLYFNIKLVIWKNSSIKVDKDKKNKPEICRICERKIPIEEFIMHINYCKEQRVFYEQMRSSNVKIGVYIGMLQNYFDKAIHREENEEELPSFNTNEREKLTQKGSTFDNEIYIIFGKRKEEFFKQSMIIYRREKEKTIDFYEKNPEKFPDIYSIIYLSFFIYFLNKNCSDYSKELNEIFSGLLSCLVNNSIAIKYILTIKDGRTRSNMKNKDTSIINLERSFSVQSKSSNEFIKDHSLNLSTKEYIDNDYPFPQKLNQFKQKLNFSSKHLSYQMFHQIERSKKRFSTYTLKSNAKIQQLVSLNNITNFPMKIIPQPLHFSASCSENGDDNSEQNSNNNEVKAKDLAKKLFLFESEEIERKKENFRVKSRFQQDEEEKEFIFFQRKTKEQNNLNENDSSISTLNLEKVHKQSYSSNDSSPGVNLKKPSYKKFKKSLFSNSMAPEIECVKSKNKILENISLSEEELVKTDTIIISLPTPIWKQEKKTGNLNVVTSNYSTLEYEQNGNMFNTILNYNQFGDINRVFTELINEIEEENKRLLKPLDGLYFSDTESEEIEIEGRNCYDNKNIKEELKESTFIEVLSSISSHSNYTVTTSIFDFDFVIEIAKGGYGRVDLYKKKTTGDFYSIKSVNINSMKELNLSSTLKNETLVLNEINNNYVVRCYYIFKDKTNYYYVMEYMPGGDLYKLLSKYTLSQKTIQLIVGEVVLALEYLHSMKIIHRDIKPENILISKEGHFKLTDFGLSQSNNKKAFNTFVIGEKEGLFNKDEEENESSSNGNNYVVGTLNYMAPELFTDEYEATYAVDYWALGVLIYELYTFKVPFNAESAKDTKNQIINLNVNWEDIDNKEIKDTYKNIDDAIDLIKKFIVKNPYERWGDDNIEDIKAHKFFNGFNWSEIKEIKSSEVLMHVKSLVIEMNKKIKLASKNQKNEEKIIDENMQIPEDIEPIGRTNQFGCVRIDNLYDKSIDILYKRIKSKEILINEDNTVSIIEDLK